MHLVGQLRLESGFGFGQLHAPSQTTCTGQLTYRQTWVLFQVAHLDLGHCCVFNAQQLLALVQHTKHNRQMTNLGCDV